MLLAGALAIMVGVMLGLLGGGGSILTVPLFVYALGMGSKEAIATSLLVVGVTSIAGVVQYAHSGQVNWRTGLVFSAFAMAGAYVGGRGAAFVLGSVLLTLFAVMMVVSGIAMLRPRGHGSDPTPKPFSLWKVGLEGLLVGGFTGLVGAGGGFLVVPALVIFGGMEMRKAIGTSLLVIALKAFTGLAGYLSHVSIDLKLASLVSAVAVVGTLLGSALSRRVSTEQLRRGFAWVVLSVAGFILYKQLPEPVVLQVFVARWPFWAGGTAIGIFLLLFLLYGRHMLSVSTGFEVVCAVPFDSQARRSWRLPFMVGIISGGALAATLGGGVALTTTMGAFDQMWQASLPVKAALFTLGGVLIGFGTRLAGGCTSGHGISGVAQLAFSSLIATGSFMVSGYLTTQLLIKLLVG
jgi:uncharacterized membrane protein YfcA